MTRWIKTICLPGNFIDDTAKFGTADGRYQFLNELSNEEFAESGARSFRQLKCTFQLFYYVCPLRRVVRPIIMVPPLKLKENSGI